MMPISKQDSKAEALKGLAVLIEPLGEYWPAMRAWFSTDQLNQLAKRINSDEFDIPKLVKLTLSTIVISTIINAMLPAGEGDKLEIVALPLLNEALFVFLFLGGALVSALVTFLPLRWAGGIATLKHAFVAGAFTNATLFPLFTLLDGIIFGLLHFPLVGGPLIRDAYSIASGLIFCRLLARIHQISFIRAFCACVLSAIIIVPFIGLIVAILSALHQGVVSAP
jgi:hypothetical protein